jgi:serine/threonine-protein kinase
MNQRLRIIDEIFNAALELPDGERLEFLRRHCGDDQDLFDEVQQLLAASAASEDELSSRFDGIRDRFLRSAFSEDDAEDLSGQRIGAWLLEHRIARGGLATVYRARRDDGAFNQVAAFKVLRRGLDTDDLVLRFRAERQILSSLEHPAIAQILDGGALDNGRPYLVLEFVEGLAITDYCESNDVPVQGRAQLLIEVLQALQHAHKRLVVHRDIKPSNILVSDEGNVTLLDFGIAKLLDASAWPGTASRTRTGMSMLTPGYGSPEQLAGEMVTTASDIYQTGLVLYELLTGRRHDTKAPRALLAEPPLPSELLRGGPRHVQVRGDLDAITRKAMHCDPAQRYGSAGEMVADLQNYLAGRAVTAQADTLRYRLAKLNKRKPWLLPAVVVGVLVIAAYLVTLTLYARQLKVEQQRSLAAQAFLVEILRSPDPFSPADPELGQDITVRKALDLGVQRLQQPEYADPILRAALLGTLGDVYSNIDQHVRAIELKEQALPLEREVFGADSSQVIETLRSLADLHKTVSEYERAEGYYRQQLELARKAWRPDHPEVGVAEAAFGAFECSQGRLERCIYLLMEAIPKMRQSALDYAGPLIQAEVALAGNGGMERLDEFLAMLAQTRLLAEQAFGADSLMAVLVYTQMATSQSARGEFAQAELMFLKAVAINDQRLGRGHGTSLAARNNLAVHHTRTGNFAAAEQIQRELLEQYVAKYGPAHPSVALSYQNLATSIARQGLYAEALPMHLQALDTYRAALNEDNYVIAIPLLSIAYAHIQLGEPDQARAAAREASVHFAATAPGTLFEGVAQCLEGAALAAQGQIDEGDLLVEQSHAILKAESTPEPYASLCFPSEP